MNRSFLFSAAYLLHATLFAQSAPMVTPPQDSSLIAQVSQDYENKQSQNDNDMDALRRWLQDKRLVSLKELGGDLSISGEVRTEGQYTNEIQAAYGSNHFIRQRGVGAKQKKPQVAWDVEFNLMLDYHTERTWAAMKLEFDNDMGTVSGTSNKVRLEKAYLGGRLIAGDTFTWDAEVGRRYLANVYDSKIQFGSLFDGGLFRFGKAFEEIGDFYVNLGGFVVNDKTNHYGEVIEIGALKIANTPLNMRYSLINWYHHYTQNQLNKGNEAAEPDQVPGYTYFQPWNYLVNQYTIFYQTYPDWLGKRLFKVYAAGLINVLAEKTVLTNYTRQNLGGYAGVSIGLVKKAGDWAVDVSYQIAQAQVAPPTDASGIGRGNAANVGMFTAQPDGKGVIATRATTFSPYNYQGFQIEALYGFTNNITLQQSFQMSWTLDTSFGTNSKYKQYELEFIYAF